MSEKGWYINELGLLISAATFPNEQPAVGTPYYPLRWFGELDGEIRVCDDGFGASEEEMLFYHTERIRLFYVSKWSEGNWSCDCNRSTAFGFEDIYPERFPDTHRFCLGESINAIYVEPINCAPRIEKHDGSEYDRGGESNRAATAEEVQRLRLLNTYWEPPSPRWMEIRG